MVFNKVDNVADNLFKPSKIDPTKLKAATLDIQNIRKLGSKELDSRAITMLKGLKSDDAIKKLSKDQKRALLELEAVATQFGGKKFNLDDVLDESFAKGLKPIKGSEEKALKLLEILNDPKNASKFTDKVKDKAKWLKGQILATGTTGVIAASALTVALIMALSGTSPSELIGAVGDEAVAILGKLTEELMNATKAVVTPVTKGIGDILWDFMSSVGWILIPLLGIGIIVAIFYFTSMKKAIPSPAE